MLRPSTPLLAVVSLAALVGAAPSPARIERTVAVPSGTKFVLDTDGGSVVVRGTSRSDASVVVTSPSGDLESRITVEVKQVGDEVRVVSRRKRGGGSSWFGLFGTSRTSPRFEVEVPQRTPVRVDTSGGQVQASALRADASLETSGGAIRVTDHVGRLAASTSGGPIRLERVRGSATVETSGGRIEARDIDGALRAMTSGGSIEIAGVTGDVRAETSGGSIRIHDAGGRIEAETSGGSVEASFRRGNARGGSLESAGGSVRVALDPAIDLSIEASSSAGSVRSELPVRGTVSRSSVRGTLGKGGNLLRLHTSAGSVEIGAL